VGSTYVNNLRLEEMTTGEKSGTWGNITNVNLELVGQALGYGTRAIADASTDNITIADGASDADRSMYLKLTGGGQACTITLLPNTSSKMWIMENATSYTLTFSQGSGANVAIKAGQTKMIFADGLGGGAVVYELGTIAVQNIQADGTVTVGIDDTGYDVTFFGATTGKKLFWDESADTLNVAGTTALAGNLSVTGITSNADGAVATPSITNTGDLNTGVYWPGADELGVTTGGVEQFRFGSNSVSPGSKNLIENGAMNVNQRGTVTGLGGTNNVYSGIDRWLFRAEGVGQARVNTSRSAQSSANSLIMKGVRNAIEIDVTTAESAVAAGECLMLAQKLEAQNLQHLLYGTSGAKDMTLSFVMKSPKAGTHCVSINQGDANRSYIAEFTMASANVFEYFSMTIPGDTGGAISNDTGEGMRLHFPLTAGTNFHASAGSWFNGEDYATSNQQNLLDNASNNIYISAVQLEIGSVFTGFEFEDFGTTLQKCQRVLVSVGDNLFGNAFAYGSASATSATVFTSVIILPVTMRANPSFSGDSDWIQGVFRGTGYNGTGGSQSLFRNSVLFTTTGASSMTAGDGGYYVYRGGKSGFISAEL